MMQKKWLGRIYNYIMIDHAALYGDNGCEAYIFVLCCLFGWSYKTLKLKR